MDALEFLEFSKKLDITQEAEARSCISRAYYCAYHEVKKFVQIDLNVDIDKVKGGTHERVSKTLLSEKTPKLKGLGYKMVTFHSKRVVADYILAKDCPESEAKEAIKECEKILTILNECRNSI
ncbi:hypothetical protein OHW82_13215 [Acinetobacter baumannii]|nr:hypothetical protein [Acinetobacter baumannii]